MGDGSTGEGARMISVLLADWIARYGSLDTGSVRRFSSVSTVHDFLLKVSDLAARKDWLMRKMSEFIAGIAPTEDEAAGMARMLWRFATRYDDAFQAAAAEARHAANSRLEELRHPR
jgi:hypothetical protein